MPLQSIAPNSLRPVEEYIKTSVNVKNQSGEETQLTFGTVRYHLIQEASASIPRVLTVSVMLDPSSPPGSEKVLWSCKIRSPIDLSTETDEISVSRPTSDHRYSGYKELITGSERVGQSLNNHLRDLSYQHHDIYKTATVMDHCDVSQEELTAIFS